ncbi:MAG: YggS family pyridoxal phosphate-dependent enzyme [Mongoliibacter sp.]|uniref:YggS family pyridoxal phosphate-dependent enzyme n=1 Tax=Mongoliibacter sp. TaxID=2022438 RepID=UPI0012F438BE|nr:YggS family pyridoxal phosphate-dependent enzyme [Mongoliibacter sp.]TVP43666.1 MAG: YggS family pyridoxal phosphate-dependent enzyme [Mongoliibacter sp.]
MSIKANLIEIKNTFTDPNCKLIAVSKTKPAELIMEAYEAGVRDFGENKVQEMVEKAEKLPKDIRWHMIGHLQRNKVKYMAEFVHLIHGVDSLKLLKEINKQAIKVNRTINCLLQVHIAEEDSKFGFDEKELLDMLAGEVIHELKNVKIIGLMGMATFTENQIQVEKEFAGLKSLKDKLSQSQLPENFDLQELSMGMTGDYLIAQKQGSTMVRIGTAIFGERDYN